MPSHMNGISDDSKKLLLHVMRSVYHQSSFLRAAHEIGSDQLALRVRTRACA